MSKYNQGFLVLHDDKSCQGTRKTVGCFPAFFFQFRDTKLCARFKKSLAHQLIQKSATIVSKKKKSATREEMLPIICFCSSCCPHVGLHICRKVSFGSCYICSMLVNSVTLTVNYGVKQSQFTKPTSEPPC